MINQGQEGENRRGGSLPELLSNAARGYLVSDARLMNYALSQELDHAVILLDPNGRVVSWLGGAARLFGYQPEEMVEQPLWRLFLSEDVVRGELEWELRTALSYGKAEADRWHVRKDGVRIWVTSVTTAVHDEQRNLLGFLKIARDRTDLRGHVDTLQNRLDTLLRGEAKRHAVLGTLAHELRAPLGPLVNSTRIIHAVAADNPQAMAAADIIARQVHYIDSMVKNLLETTRVAVGKLTLHRGTTDLHKLIDQAVETCSSALAARSQAVEVLIPGSLTIDLDPDRFQQVLVNLISNASKFSPPGQRIWIKASVDSEQLVLRVEDQGRGIPAELLPRIFELFTQAAEEEGGNGLGLGLGVVKAIVELHGGTVQAKSEGKGRGTEIIIRLPLQKAAAHVAHVG